MRSWIVAPWLALVVACGSSSASPGVVDSGIDQGVDVTDSVSPDDTNEAEILDANDASDASDVGDASKAAACVSTFGSALPSGFMRLDGTIVAVLSLTDAQCAMYNSTHLVAELSLGGDGSIYRVVINVMSTSGDPDVYFGELDHALPAPAFALGVHTGVTFDYPTMLGLHYGTAPFALTTTADLAPKVLGELDVGAEIAVYAQGTGGTSVHDTHRHALMDDGALVLRPTSTTPHWLVFHFIDDAKF